MRKIFPLIVIVILSGCNDAGAQSSYHQAEGFHYFEVIKGKANPGDKLPLIIGFHYSSSTPLEASKDYDSIKIPVRIILPKGNYRKRNGFTYFPPDYYSKDTLAQIPIAMKTLDSIAAFVRAIGKKYNAKPVVAGFSQGGDLSFLLPVYHPELIKAGFPLAGFLHRQRWEDAKKRGQTSVPIHIFQGESDKIIALDFSREEVAELKSYFSITLTTYPGVGHDFSPEMKRDYAALMTRLLQQ